MARFIGRNAELGELRRMLGGAAGPVVLVGPPGVGKTALAREVLAAGDGWFCDLTDASSALAVCGAVTGALGATFGAATAEQGAERVATALGGRAGVLVLDNAEHLAAELGPLVGRWASAGVGARVLVTSRVRLGAAGERDVAVEPMSRDDAAALFAARAADARPGYEPAEADVAAIGEIVDRLDRVPLAIELAAARMRVLGPAQIRDRLCDRLDVLARGAASESRWSTLEAATAWSWELLLPAEQAALAQCAVFRGGFDVDAAEAVIDAGDADVLDAVQALCEHSLVHAEPVPEAPDRQRLSLLASVRAFAAGRLDDDGAAEGRHARHYLARGRAARDAVEAGDLGAPLRELMREERNLLAAHARALAGGDRESALRAAVCLDPLMQLRADSEARVRLVDAALAQGAVDELPPVLAAEALLVRAPAQRRIGRPEAGRADLGLARGFAERAGDDVLAMRADWLLGVDDYYRGEFAPAVERLEDVRGRARDAGLRHLEGRVLIVLGNALGDLGDIDRCRPLLREAHDALAAAGDDYRAATALLNLADVNLMAGRLSDASWQLEQMLALLDGMEHGVPMLVDMNRVVGEVNLALIDHERGRVESALDALSASADAFHRLGDPAYESACLLYVAAAATDLGRCDAARGALERAAGMIETRGARGEAHRLARLATIEAIEAQVDAAADAFARAREVLGDAGGAIDRALVDVLEGYLDLARGDRDAAARRLDGADEAASTSQEVRLAARGLRAAIEAAADGAPALQIEATGAWFCAPGGDRVDLRRRGAVRRVLAALAARRRSEPGEAVSVEQLVEAGWPGELMQHESAVKRVYTAAWTLRKLGLGEIVVSADGGYLLDPDVPIAG